MLNNLRRTCGPPSPLPLTHLYWTLPLNPFVVLVWTSHGASVLLTLQGFSPYLPSAAPLPPASCPHLCKHMSILPTIQLVTIPPICLTHYRVLLLCSRPTLHLHTLTLTSPDQGYLNRSLLVPDRPCSL